MTACHGHNDTKRRGNGPWRHDLALAVQRSFAVFKSQPQTDERP